MSFEFQGFGAVPGIHETRETHEAGITWGDSQYNNQYREPAHIDGSTRDSDNSPDTILRAGLIMAFNTSTKAWTIWANAGANGTGTASGVLLYDLNTQRAGADQNRYLGWVLRHGNVRSSKLIEPGAGQVGLVGSTNEATLRTQLGAIMQLDDTPYV